MTVHKDLKKIIRARQQKTGESYTTAHAHVMRERDTLLGKTAVAPTEPGPVRADAAVLKVNQGSARVRIFGEDGQVTFRSIDIDDLVPGHIVTLVIDKRWTWRDDYASGRIEDPRVDIESLRLIPLPIDDHGLVDLRSGSEPHRKRDAYAAVWRERTAMLRHSYEFHPIAWGAPDGRDSLENLTCDAAELARAGDEEGARALLMQAVCVDLRCIDAHAHLGNLEFDRSPERAMLHYEIGLRIGELSLPPGFDGVLQWGFLYNRPFLRCLHGYGLCLWRLGKLAEAQQAFERLLSLNPGDNQGVRTCWDDVRHGRSWAQVQGREENRAVARRARLR